MRRDKLRYRAGGGRSGRRTVKYTDTEAGRSLAFLRNSKESIVAGEEERKMGRQQEVRAEKGQV